ncbi:hypothetical protein QBC45DRAFT_428720, partial [Copromyces sp. CBS 386.78]
IDDDDEETPPQRHEHSDHPIFNTQYETLDKLVTAVQQWGRELGYSLVKGRSTNPQTGIGYTRCELVCSAGPIRKADNHSRSTSTSKQGCL